MQNWASCLLLLHSAMINGDKWPQKVLPMLAKILRMAVVFPSLHSVLSHQGF
jgi:hypothetical protein